MNWQVVYPAIGIDRAELSVNFGREPFKFDLGFQNLLGRGPDMGTYSGAQDSDFFEHDATSESEGVDEEWIEISQEDEDEDDGPVPQFPEGEPMN